MKDYFIDIDSAVEEAGARGLVEFFILNIEDMVGRIFVKDKKIEIELEEDAIDQLKSGLSKDSNYNNEQFVLITDFTVSSKAIGN